MSQRQCPWLRDDMLDNLVHQLLRQYHSRIPSPDSDYAEPLTEREGVGLVQRDGDTFHVPTDLMGLGRRDAIRTLGLDASTLHLIYILRFWTLDAIDLWGAIGPGHHDDLVGGLARSGSSPGN